MVVYAGSSGLALPPTSGKDKDRILAALDALEAGGSTNGAEGIRLAYSVAEQHFVKNGINRVILATDGDFNVGTTSEGDLVRLIEGASSIFLSVLGVGTGNVKDSTIGGSRERQLRVSILHEARRSLVKEAGATLVTVAGR
jgi:Ca-activated chloride channel family protein